MRKSPNAKLSEQTAREIRERIRSGATGESLAREYGVNRSAISRIRNGKAYRDADTVVIRSGDLARLRRIEEAARGFIKTWDLGGPGGHEVQRLRAAILENEPKR